jgi:shikimate kinase
MNSNETLDIVADGRPIALVGMMGVGKTTIGRRLALRLGLPFVDADHEIVQAAALSVAEIFDRFGEAHFRDGERRVIARLLEGEQKVIATGGGAFINEQTRRLMLEKACVVWLDADLDTLVERTSRKTDRPLLNTGNPRETLEKLCYERNPIYAQAPIRVQSRTKPHDIMVDIVLKALR